MIEIMGKMALCLIIALLLGFLIGWLFAKALKSEEEYVELEVEEEDENELLARIRQLETLYENEKELSTEYENKNKELKGQLMKKVNLLNNTSDTLKEVQTKKSNSDDKQKVRELQALLDKKNAELMEFEEVLIKAETTIEEKDRYINQLKNSK